MSVDGTSTALPEVTYAVQGPKTSQQSGGLRASAYTLRRVNIPGPNTGFPYIISFGPKTVTATTIGQFVVQLPGSVRLMALGWSCNGTSGASTIRPGRAATVTSTLSSQVTALSSTDTTSTIDLATTPSGIVLYNEKASNTYYIKKFTWTSGADGATLNDPESPPTGSTGQLPVFSIGNPAASTVADLCIYLLVMPTKHPNTLSVSD